MKINAIHNIMIKKTNLNFRSHNNYSNNTGGTGISGGVFDDWRASDFAAFGCLTITAIASLALALLMMLHSYNSGVKNNKNFLNKQKTSIIFKDNIKNTDNIIKQISFKA